MIFYCTKEKCLKIFFFSVNATNIGINLTMSQFICKKDILITGATNVYSKSNRNFIKFTQKF